MAREVRWERMFVDQLEAACAEFPLCWLSYGLCEPHGPQNTLGLDALKAHALCVRAAEAHGGIVAPPDYWHIHELGRYALFGQNWVGQVRGWLSAVPPWVHFKNVLYHLRAVDALEFHAAILVTGHYGPNWKDLKTLLEFWQPHFATRFHGLPDFEATPGQRADHAGFVETSQLWALEPACVDLTRIPNPPPPLPNFAMGSDGPQATRRDGEKIVAAQVEWLGKKACELIAEYKAPPLRRALTFTETESLWQETERTLLPKLLTMEELHAGESAPPEGSRWRANWPVRYPPK